MSDKLNLMLESILQESRAAHQEIAKVKKDMVTHNIFENHIKSVNNQLQSISSEQNQQKGNIDKLNEKLSIQVKLSKKSVYNKIIGFFLIIVFGSLGLCIPNMISAHTMHNVSGAYHGKDS